MVVTTTQGLSTATVGLYVDVENLSRNGGYGMQYNILREFLCRDAAQPVRLNAYAAFDAERARSDTNYRKGTRDFHSALRDYGFKVIEQQVRWYTDDSGSRYGKANADLYMAIDALLQSESLDRVMLATGDGDFVPVVRALQNKGCRVEILAFKNVSRALRCEADLFISGFLVPGLLTTERDSWQDEHHEWGTSGSRVRGTCYMFNQDRGFGFVRFLRHISSGLWITDPRHPDSPYDTAFVHGSQFPPEFDLGQLPSRDFIFEFDLETSPKKNLMATHVRPSYQY